jgi:hypothetical protein
MTTKGGAPGKKREMQQATVNQNENLIKQIDAQLVELHKFQDDPDSLQDAIDTLVSQVSILKEQTEDMKARMKADENAVIEKKAKALKEKESE